MSGGATTSQSLSTLAYERLRQEIIELRRPPGQRLVERELATELEISRIPLREALKLLEAEGLVVIVPRQGSMVAPFTAADVRHLYDVRESLEALAATLAARHRDAGGLAAAQAQLVAAREAMTRGDHGAVADANASFHEVVIGMSGNPLLQALMQPLNARVRWLFHLAQGPDQVDHLCREHEEIHEAIAAGEAERAGRLSAEHVRATREPSLARAAAWAAADLDPVEVTRSRQRERRG